MVRIRADARMRADAFVCGCVRMRGYGCFLRIRADAFGADSADLCGCGVICQLILQPRVVSNQEP